MIDDKMTNFNKMLKEHGLNFPERMYVYGGTALGAVAPVLYNRWIGFGDAEGNPAREVTYWVASVITAIPLSVTGAAVGYAAGISAVATSRILAGLKELEEKEVEERKKEET